MQCHSSVWLIFLQPVVLLYVCGVTSYGDLDGGSRRDPWPVFRPCWDLQKKAHTAGPRVKNESEQHL